MKQPIAVFRIGLLMLVATGCSEKIANINELRLPSEYLDVAEIISIADCDSPFGTYLTEVRSYKDGSCYFYQKFENGPPFIVTIDAENKAYLIDTQKTILDTLSPEDVDMIRGHELHKMSMLPHFFYDDIQFEKTGVFKGKDRLGHAVTIYYDPEEQQIKKIDLINPKDTTQTIEVIYEKWVPHQLGKMAKEVTIVQAQKDTFQFKFSKLNIKNRSHVNYTVFDQ